ncbi:MAG: carboxylating nicotinate-nucleotide diphosphorylase [archaeon]
MDIVTLALNEDIGSGDVTSRSVVPEGSRAVAEIRVKEEGIICGLSVAEEAFRRVDSAIEFKGLFCDGDRVAAGCVVAEVSGPTRGILAAERTALNFLQHLSGIATEAARYADLGVRVLDTRKTTPGLRELEKYAVMAGGGANHRMGLYDAVLIKDNHKAIAGGIAKAVQAARAKNPGLGIEVEVATLDEAREALSAGADTIMLDNMDVQTMKKAVRMINKRARVEASGGVDLKSVAEIAATGVDMISVGSALTLSAKALDIALYIKSFL